MQSQQAQGLQVSSVSVRLAGQKEYPVLAYATAVLGGAFAVHGIRVIWRDGGLMIAMPSHGERVRCPHCMARNYAPVHYCRRCGNQLRHLPIVTYHDICHPINEACRTALSEAVVAAYAKAKEEVEHASRGECAAAVPQDRPAA